MSMHKLPLSRLEEEGLKAHGLSIETPSQLSDAFRQGVAWALSHQEDSRAIPPVQDEQQPVKLQHMAYSEDGVLRWMTGWKIDNCELYAMPDFGRAPKLYAAPITHTDSQPEQGGLLLVLRPIHAMILNALDRDAEEGRAGRGEMAAELRATLGCKGCR